MAKIREPTYTFEQLQQQYIDGVIRLSDKFKKV